MKRAGMYAFFFVCLFTGFFFCADKVSAAACTTSSACPTETTVDDSLPDDLTQPVIIQKTDPNGAQLSDAELSVVDSNGVVQTNIVTTYNTTTLNLSKGEYFLHESGVPDGYQKAKDIWFSVNPTVDSRNGKYISTDSVQFTGLTEKGGVRQDTEFGKIVYCINPEKKGMPVPQLASISPMSVSDSEYFIVYGNADKLSACWTMYEDSAAYEQKLANLNKEFNYLVNQGYKKLGEPFEGMTDAQSYAATQLAIWATLEPGVRQMQYGFNSGWAIWDNPQNFEFNNGSQIYGQAAAFLNFANLLYNDDPAINTYYMSEESSTDRDTIIAKAKELFENAQNADELANTQYDHYMLYYSEQDGYCGTISEYQNLISAAASSDPITITMIDEPIPEEKEETPKEEKETPKEEKKTPKAETKTVNTQTVQTNGVNTGTTTNMMMWAMTAISALGAAVLIKKEAE